MAARIRKQIYIEADQNVMLKRISGERGVPEAEIIRQAITKHVHDLHIPRRDIRAWAAERDFIMRLMQQGPLSGERSWQREDLHER